MDSGPPVLVSESDPPAQQAEGERDGSHQRHRRVGWLPRLAVDGTRTEEEECQTDGNEAERQPALDYESPQMECLPVASHQSTSLVT